MNPQAFLLYRLKSVPSREASPKIEKASNVGGLGVGPLSGTLEPRSTPPSLRHLLTRRVFPVEGLLKLCPAARDLQHPSWPKSLVDRPTRDVTEYPDLSSTAVDGIPF